MGSTFQSVVHFRVYPADKEGSDGRNLAQISAILGELLQSGKIRLGNLLVDVAGEDKGYVDVDSLADQLLDGRDSFRRCRHLNVDVGSIYGSKKPPRFLNGLFSLVSQIRIGLQTDVAISTLCLPEQVGKDIGSPLDIFDRQRLVNFLGALALHHE